MLKPKQGYLSYLRAQGTLVSRAFNWGFESLIRVYNLNYHLTYYLLPRPLLQGSTLQILPGVWVWGLVDSKYCFANDSVERRRRRQGAKAG